MQSSIQPITPYIEKTQKIRRAVAMQLPCSCNALTKWGLCIYLRHGGKAWCLKTLHVFDGVIKLKLFESKT